MPEGILRSSEQLAKQLGCSRQYLLGRAREAHLQNWVGEFRVWSQTDIDLIKPLVQKRIASWPIAAQLNLVKGLK